MKIIDEIVFENFILKNVQGSVIAYKSVTNRKVHLFFFLFQEISR